jgi:hypothetical protein
VEASVVVETLETLVKVDQVEVAEVTETDLHQEQVVKRHNLHNQVTLAHTVLDTMVVMQIQETHLEHQVLVVAQVPLVAMVVTMVVKVVMVKLIR